MLVAALPADAPPIEAHEPHFSERRDLVVGLPGERFGAIVTAGLSLYSAGDAAKPVWTRALPEGARQLAADDVGRLYVLAGARVLRFESRDGAALDPVDLAAVGARLAVDGAGKRVGVLHVRENQVRTFDVESDAELALVDGPDSTHRLAGLVFAPRGLVWVGIHGLEGAAQVPLGPVSAVSVLLRDGERFVVGDWEGGRLLWLDDAGRTTRTVGPYPGRLFAAAVDANRAALVSVTPGETRLRVSAASWTLEAPPDGVALSGVFVAVVVRGAILVWPITPG